MLNLLLISGFTAFFYAIIDFFLSMFFVVTDVPVFRAILSFAISVVGTFLIGYSGIKSLVLYASCGAFFGIFLTIVVHRINTYQAAVVRAVGNPRQ
jgi:hypothetical protein